MLSSIPVNDIKSHLAITTHSARTNGSVGINSEIPHEDETSDSLEVLLAAVESFSDKVAARPNHGSVDFPVGDIERLFAIQAMSAPLPKDLGGMGLGVESGGHLPLLRLLNLVGSADLVLGRIYEGHVNALILIANYGTEGQLVRAAEHVHRGLLFGVWNTGLPEVLRLRAHASQYVFEGLKTFASGASKVARPIVTGEIKDRGWQMTLPRMDDPSLRSSIRIDPSFWQPMGMEASQSYQIDFTGATLEGDDLIGAPGDFYRDPVFRGGSIRFAAVHAGAVIRLHKLFAQWLRNSGRAGDPYQIARLGEIALNAQECVMWVERAATVAEQCFSKTADKLATERMVECANMMRLAVERSATSTLQKIISGVGAHGLLRPSPFERIVRDLTMYLRQPAPDHTLAEVGKTFLRKSSLRKGETENGLWNRYLTDGSLPPRYFENIYQRSSDPWNFETSDYEAEKYQRTLASLPSLRYGAGLEVGCSIGVLTELLATRCKDFLAVDVSVRALEIASARCKGQPGVRFERMDIPCVIPDGCYDLIVVSEIAYYWSREVLEACACRLALHQVKGGNLVLVHLTTPVDDYPLTGDQVHEAWMDRPEWKTVRSERYDCYRVDVLERL